MKSKIFLKPCPFGGAEVRTRKGINNITFFHCTDEKCRALISFGGDKVIDRGTVEARNPIDNFNRRADNG